MLVVMHGILSVIVLNLQFLGILVLTEEKLFGFKIAKPAVPDYPGHSNFLTLNLRTFKKMQFQRSFVGMNIDAIKAKADALNSAGKG